MDLDINLLRTFQAVALEGSVSKAAQTLHLTQPAISLQLKKLEQQLSRPLFVRTRYGLNVTTDGEFLLEKAALLNDFTETILTEFGQTKPAVTKLKIGSTFSLSQTVLTKCLKKFLDQNPAVSITVEYPLQSQMIQDLKLRKIAAAFTYGPVNDPSLKVEELMKDEIILVGSSKLDLPKKISTSDLKKFPFIGFNDSLDYCTQIINRRFGKILESEQPRFSAEDFGTLLPLCVQGVGLTFLARSVANQHLQNGSLQEIKLIGEAKLNCPYVFITKRNVAPCETAHALKEHIKSHILGS